MWSKAPARPRGTSFPSPRFFPQIFLDLLPRSLIVAGGSSFCRRCAQSGKSGRRGGWTKQVQPERRPGHSLYLAPGVVRRRFFIRPARGSWGPWLGRILADTFSGGSGYSLRSLEKPDKLLRSGSPPGPFFQNHKEVEQSKSYSAQTRGARQPWLNFAGDSLPTRIQILPIHPGRRALFSPPLGVCCAILGVALATQ
jgi:hypothetical protein